MQKRVTKKGDENPSHVVSLVDLVDLPLREEREGDENPSREERDTCGLSKTTSYLFSKKRKKVVFQSAFFRHPTKKGFSLTGIYTKKKGFSLLLVIPYPLLLFFYHRRIPTCSIFRLYIMKAKKRKGKSLFL